MTAALYTLQGYSLNVPDVSRAADFYTAFGLTVRPDGNDARLLLPSGVDVGRLSPAPRKSLGELSFSANEADSAQLRVNVSAAGGSAVSTIGEHAGLLVTDPDGNHLRLVYGAQERARPGPRDVVVRVSDYGAAPQPGYPVEIARLSHVFLFTPDIDRAVRFYRQALGFVLSDSVPGIVAFMHLPHGSDHHQIGFVQSDAKGFHHAAFDLPSIDAVGIGARRMASRGYVNGWGFGRHLAGSNFFHYVQDPFGSFAEYSCDIDFVPAGVEWPARVLPPELSLHSWGARVPDYFVENAEGIGKTNAS